MKILKQLTCAHFIFLMFFSYEALGQCKERFIKDIGGGATVTCRIQTLHTKLDCHIMSSNFEPPLLLFDTTWELSDIITAEKEYYLNDKCLLLKEVPSVDSCINNLAIGNGKEKIKALQKLICFYDTIDTTFSVLHDQFNSMENERLKAYLARDLRFTQNSDAIPALLELAEDTCEYVRLEVGRSLALIGEKEVSYELLAQIWEMGIFPINCDRFYYFTGSMRNINTPEAIDFLVQLTLDTNQYCALDASICLMQAGKLREGLIGIRPILTTDDLRLFAPAARALYAYFPLDVLIPELRRVKPFANPEISDFINCIIYHYGGENEK